MEKNDLTTVLIEVLITNLASSDPTFTVGENLFCCTLCSMVGEHTLYCPWTIARAIINSDVEKLYLGNK